MGEYDSLNVSCNGFSVNDSNLKWVRITINHCRFMYVQYVPIKLCTQQTMMYYNTLNTNMLTILSILLIFSPQDSGCVSWNQDGGHDQREGNW